MTQNPMATAADYADAMLVARRAKNWLVGLLLAMLVMQLALFFLVRFERIQLKVTPTADEVVVGPSTQPTAEPADASVNVRAQQFLQYVVGLIDFLGVALVIVLAFVLVLLLVIMLVGRLIGVAPVTQAFIGCLLLAVLVFPWQAFLDNVGLTSAQADFKIPGVLYTWAELAQRANFTTEDIRVAMLRWARFVGFPLAAIVLLLWVHLKSRRGLRLALGETEPANQEMPG